jgi:hypothetical protein
MLGGTLLDQVSSINDLGNIMDKTMNFWDMPLVKIFDEKH